MKKKIFSALLICLLFSCNNMSSEDYLKSGESKFYIKDYTGAKEDYIKAKELDPKNEKINTILTYVTQLDNCSNLIKLDPKNPSNYILRASLKSNEKDFKGAIDDYTTCIEVDPKNLIAYEFRSALKYDLKDYKGAEADYTKIIELEPENVNAYRDRGVVKYHLKDYRGAEVDFSKVIEFEPKNVTTYNIRALTKYYLNDYRGAIDDYTKIIELEPENESTQLNRHYVIMISNYSKSINIDPKNSLNFYNRGLWKIALDDKNGGCLDLYKAIELGDASAHDVIKKYCN